MESTVDNQVVRRKKKMENMFRHLDYKNLPKLCPVRDVLSQASDQWSILILLWLGYFPELRFNKLKRYVYGISSKVLSQRLKTLQEQGFIDREVFPEVPLRVEYRLTDFGEKYAERLLELTEWMHQNSPRIQAHREDYGLK